ncbi:MAG: RagB/SusD family nutrient uptake outer membrane protein [Segetibacter sp.]|nr:RagB/SusD family nutrient uptake outer membrane protein [Segetibacter sp.]
MNKLRKIIIIICLAVPIVTMLGSCNKFLDRKPLTSTLDDLNQGGLEGQIFGLYSFFRTSYGNVSSLPHLGLHGFRSDDAVKGSEPSDGAEWVAPMDQFKYDKSFPGARDYWDDHYKLINFANTALQTADSLKLTSDADLINLAEARFFRAFAYFDLVRTFGEVPKIDFRIYEASQANVPKSPIAVIYTLIDQDLQFAEATLPASWGSKFVGRLTSGAARTLHAKAYLFRGNFPMTLALSQAVINSNQYALYSPYWKIFKDEGENSSESILEVQNEVTLTDDYGSVYATTQNVRQSTASGWNLGWGWNTPTESLVNAYEPGDPRKDATILFAGQSDDPANGGYGRTLPKAQEDGGILFSRYYNKKVYADPAKRIALNRLDQAGWINQRIFRYADVVLMAAEAANETGNGKLAETYLEQVRARARNGASVLPFIPFTSKEQMRAAIKQERRVEFGMEEERFFDLVRWGDAVSVLGPLGYQDKNKYYPIPQSFIDKSGGVLKQNPDYP